MGLGLRWIALGAGTGRADPALSPGFATPQHLLFCIIDHLQCFCLATGHHFSKVPGLLHYPWMAPTLPGKTGTNCFSFFELP